MSIVAGKGYEWFALRVMHQNEFKVSGVFRDRLGIESKVPVRKVWGRGKNGIIVYSKPILNSFVFIFANLKSINWELIFAPSGVLGVVRQMGKPAPIPESQIELIEKLGESENPVYEVDLSKLKANDRVQIVNGPMKGAIGSFLKTGKKKGKFIVLVDVFKRALETEVEIDCIRPY